MRKTALAVIAASMSLAPMIATPSTAHAANPTKVSAYFVSAKSNDVANKALLNTMKADAITFGDRIVPVSKTSLPSQLSGYLGTRKVYLFKGGINWNPKALSTADRKVVINGATYVVMYPDARSAVVSSNANGDATGSMIRSGNALGAKTIIGLPRPQNNPNLTYKPDLTYRGVLTNFTARFTKDAYLDGADGFYLTTEMPVTDTAFWNDVRDMYRVQNRAVASVKPGATVLISPFFESRLSKGSRFTPAQAGRGAKMLLDTASGTRVIIAPQDGLGVGSTALRVDRRTGFIAPTESYLAAMKSTVGSHLWANIELMKPNGTSRLATTRSRVSQQLYSESPYVAGSIAFMWDDPTRKIGAVYVSGGMSGMTNGFGRTFI